MKTSKLSKKTKGKPLKDNPPKLMPEAKKTRGEKARTKKDKKAPGKVMKPKDKGSHRGKKQFNAAAFFQARKSHFKI